MATGMRDAGEMDFPPKGETSSNLEAEEEEERERKREDIHGDSGRGVLWRLLRRDPPLPPIGRMRC